MKKSEERLTLLGTIHQDPYGLQRLSAFLDSFAPDLLLVEISPYGLAFRRRHQKRLQEELNTNLHAAATRLGMTLRDAHRHPQILAIRRQFGPPYEYRVAAAYARRHGRPLCCVDDSRFSRRLLASWSELITEDNLAGLLTLPRAQAPDIDLLYANAARRILAQQPPALSEFLTASPETDSLWTERETHLARRVLAALRRHPAKHPLYIGGWWHLTISQRPPTLRTLLALPLAQCRLLDREAI